MIDQVKQLPIVKRLNDPWYLTQAAGTGIAIALRVAGWVHASNVFLVYSLLSISTRLLIQIYDNRNHDIMRIAVKMMNKQVPAPKTTRKVAFIAALVLSQYLSKVSLALAAFSGILTALTREVTYIAQQNRLTTLAAKRST